MWDRFFPLKNYQMIQRAEQSESATGVTAYTVLIVPPGVLLTTVGTFVTSKNIISTVCRTLNLFKCM